MDTKIKDAMRIAVFSDVQGNLITLQTLLGHLQSESVDAINRRDV